MHAGMHKIYTEKPDEAAKDMFYYEGYAGQPSERCSALWGPALLGCFSTESKVDAAPLPGHLNFHKWLKELAGLGVQGGSLLEQWSPPSCPRL